MDAFALGWVDDGLVDLGQSIKNAYDFLHMLRYNKVILKVSLFSGPFSILKSFFIFKCCLPIKENGLNQKKGLVFLERKVKNNIFFHERAFIA
jgi:hypothetical protein